MLRAMEKMIRRFGSEMVLVHNVEEQQIRAFLQETQSRSQENAQREFSPLGEVHKGLHVYIGPVTPQASIGDELLYQGRVFEMRRAEPVMVGDEPAYVWGLCVEKGGESQWGN